MQDKIQYNEQGYPHGQFVRYKKKGTLIWYICNYINGEWYGYFEEHCISGKINKEYAAR
jgi:hypothetical protein